MNKTALIFGGISVDWFGVLVAAACLTGVCVACLLRKYQKGSANEVMTVFCVGAPLAVILSRLQYCLSEVDLKYTGIGYILSEMNEGGYGLYGAIGGVLAAVFVSAAVWQVKAGRLADCIAAVGAGVIAAGRFATRLTPDQRGFALAPGAFTVKSETDGLNYLAVYLLDGIVETVIFAVCLGLYFFIYRKSSKQRGEGKIAMVFLMLHGLNQVVMDSLRTDSLCLFDNDFIKASQIIGILSWLVIISVFFYQAVKNQKKFPIVYWVIIAAFVALIIISISKEYRVGSSNYISAHVTMGICMVIMAILSMYVFFESEKCPVQAKAAVRSEKSQSVRSTQRTGAQPPLMNTRNQRTSSQGNGMAEQQKNAERRAAPDIDLDFDSAPPSDNTAVNRVGNTRVSPKMMEEIRRQFDKM